MIFDDNTVSGISLSGEHITVDMLNDIINKRTINKEDELIDRCNKVLWNIYEYVKYEKGADREIEVSPYRLGLYELYDEHYSITPRYKQFIDYFQERGFKVRHDSLNNLIIIRWE